MLKALSTRRLVPLFCLSLAMAGWAAGKPHIIILGKWMAVKLFTGPNQAASVDLKVRTLSVDGKIKEFTTGEPHDVTDRLFVVRRAYRINDGLPDDEKSVQRWKWQRGGWLLVDRTTGHVGQVALADFDPYYSTASWYRDYVAYCGVSDDGERLFTVVVQLARKKPILHKAIGDARGSDSPDSECGAPEWQRNPTRVTFTPANGQKVTFAVRGHSADIATSDDDQP